MVRGSSQTDDSCTMDATANWTTGTAMRIAAAALAISCGLPSCRDHLDTAKLEGVVLDGLNTKLAPEGLLVASVTCPESVSQAQGNSFECQATFAGGGQATVTVDQKDDQGNVVYKLRRDFIVAAKVEQSIADKLKRESNVTAVVNCGDRVQPSVPKSTFQCAARDSAGKVLLFNVTVKDAQGRVTWSLAGTEPAPGQGGGPAAASPPP